MKTKQRLPYYSFDKLCSYDAPYSFVLGGRGLGKTYGFKIMAIKAFIKRGEQFIYMRRYKDEISVSAGSFFADIDRNNEFPDHDFKVDGIRDKPGKFAFIAPRSTRGDKKRKWEVFGHFIALSVAQQFKSVSYPLVTRLCYDEFIPNKGMVRELPNEATAFMEFYSTVDRWEDRVRVFFLANAVSIMNAYFLAWGVVVKEGVEWVRVRDGFVVAHFPEAKDFGAAVYETRFGKFIQGTEYADYAVGNEFDDNAPSMLAKKTSNSKYRFTLEVHSGGMFSVWFDAWTSEYYVYEKRPKSEVVYTLSPQRMDENKTLMNFTSKQLASLRGAYNNARVSFDSQITRNRFIEIFKR